MPVRENTSYPSDERSAEDRKVSVVTQAAGRVIDRYVSFPFQDCEKPIVLHIEPNSPRATVSDAPSDFRHMPLFV